MFLRYTTRRKNGKEHRYYSLVENRRVASGRVVQRHALYLGEINDSQQEAWRKTIEIFEEGQTLPRTVALFPEERIGAVAEADIVRIRLSQLSLHRPRQWGGCWLACQLWEQLGLDQFWSQRLPPSRKGTRWDWVLQVLVAYRLLDPGSEWRLYRHWFEQSAMADLLGADRELAEIHKLYECHERLLKHKRELFTHLTDRWKDLFNARFEVLLYDLTSTYFESNPPFGEEDKRRYGYSRDKRSDCVQVVIALVVTPEGFPLAYEVMPGNTSDRTTLRGFLKRIEDLYGQAERIWVMDRGIPTEEVLQEMRQSSTPIHYLVGTPKGSLSKHEQALLERPWQVVREGVQVKLLPPAGELLVLAQSNDRVSKERSMRRRQLKGLTKRLKELRQMELSRDQLLLKLGAAKSQFPAAWRLVDIRLPKESEPVDEQTFGFALRKDKLRQVRRREGRYLLRSNLSGQDPAKLWQFYIQLTQVEAAFKDLKDDLSLRPLFHQLEHRIEAHIFVAFLAYCLHVSLRARLQVLAPGLTPRSMLEKFASIQMLDVHFPTTDGRKLVFCRYTQPEKDHRMLLALLGWELPPQSPPKISQKGELLKE